MLETALENLPFDCKKRVWSYGSDTWWPYHIFVDGYLLPVNFNEKVSINRVRELRTTILNELFNGQDVNDSHDNNFSKSKKDKRLYAKT